MPSNALGTATTSIKGLADIRRGLDMVQRETLRALEQGTLLQAGELMVETAREKVPVKRGRLRDSLIPQVDKSRSGKPTVKVGPSHGSGRHFIGRFWEFGFRHHRTGETMMQPFLRPALKENRKEINRILSDGVAKRLRTRLKGRTKGARAAT